MKDTSSSGDKDESSIVSGLRELQSLWESPSQVVGYNSKSITYSLLLGTVFVSYGCCNKRPQTAWLIATGVDSLSLWRLEAGNQRVAKIIPPPRHRVEDPSLSNWILVAPGIP